MLRARRNRCPSPVRRPARLPASLSLPSMPAAGSRRVHVTEVKTVGTSAQNSEPTTSFRRTFFGGARLTLCPQLTGGIRVLDKSMQAHVVNLSSSSGAPLRCAYNCTAFDASATNSDCSGCSGWWRRRHCTLQFRMRSSLTKNATVSEAIRLTYGKRTFSCCDCTSFLRNSCPPPSADTTWLRRRTREK